MIAASPIIPSVAPFLHPVACRKLPLTGSLEIVKKMLKKYMAHTRMHNNNKAGPRR